MPSPLPSPAVPQLTASSSELSNYFPPVSANEDSFTLLKAYTLTAELIDACVAGLDERRVEFEFRVSPAEKALIVKQTFPPSGMLVVGRSGTGKTTVAVLRLWARYLQDRQAGTSNNAIFVTASATLCSQVAAMFVRLRAAAYREEVSQPTPPPLESLNAVAAHRFPLFLTCAECVNCAVCVFSACSLTHTLQIAALARRIHVRPLPASAAWRCGQRRRPGGGWRRV